MAAEIAFLKILRDDATLAASLGLGTAARVVIGQLPQTMKLPAINIIRESTNPSDVKSGTSPVDEESIVLTIRDLEYSTILSLSERVRVLLDGLENQSITVESKVINIDTSWFTNENYDNYEHQDRVIEVYEQKYSVRIKR